MLSNTNCKAIEKQKEKKKEKKEKVKGRKKGKAKGNKSEKKAYSTRYSQAVTHPSTNLALPGLTAVIGREPVFSRWYGRRQETKGKCLAFCRRVVHTREKGLLSHCSHVWIARP